MNKIKYKGKDYPTRTFTMTSEDTGEMTVTIADETLEMVIGDETLEERISKKLGENVNEQSEKIDESIYFYVEEGVLDLSPEDICKNHLDEEFEFISEEL